MDELGQALKGILEGKAFGFVVGAHSTIVSSSLGNLLTIQTQDNKATHGMPFLGPSIKVYMHSLYQHKACLWQQIHLAQGSLGAVHSVQVHWLI